MHVPQTGYILISIKKYLQACGFSHVEFSVILNAHKISFPCNERERERERERETEREREMCFI